MRAGFRMRLQSEEFAGQSMDSRLAGLMIGSGLVLIILARSTRKRRSAAVELIPARADTFILSSRSALKFYRSPCLAHPLNSTAFPHVIDSRGFERYFPVRRLREILRFPRLDVVTGNDSLRQRGKVRWQRFRVPQQLVEPVSREFPNEISDLVTRLIFTARARRLIISRDGSSGLGVLV